MNEVFLTSADDDDDTQQNLPSLLLRDPTLTECHVMHTNKLSCRPTVRRCVTQNFLSVSFHSKIQQVFPQAFLRSAGDDMQQNFSFQLKIQLQHQGSVMYTYKLCRRPTSVGGRSLEWTSTRLYEGANFARMKMSGAWDCRWFCLR